jgi:hypothetical protein
MRTLVIGMLSIALLKKAENHRMIKILVRGSSPLRLEKKSPIADAMPTTSKAPAMTKMPKRYRINSISILDINSLGCRPLKITKIRAMLKAIISGEMKYEGIIMKRKRRIIKAAIEVYNKRLF